jgi:VanZ family protein
LVYFTGWTAALVMPINSPGEWHVSGIHIDLKFLVAKTLHVSGYALLAGLAGWLRVPPRYRWVLMFVIMGHATMTEMIQEHVEGRTGNLHDVAYDHVGIALGTLLTWRWWSAPD